MIFFTLIENAGRELTLIWLGMPVGQLLSSPIQDPVAIFLIIMASTLAAITVAYKIELVDRLTVNGVIAMILVTCIASPWMTAKWGQKVKPEEKVVSSKSRNLSERVLVPVANPSTEDKLLQLAILLVKKSKGTLLPLHVLSDQRGKISPSSKTRQNQLLATAEKIAHAATVDVESIGRIDSAIARGITRSASEKNCTLIICGWKGYSTYKENFFGSVIDRMMRLSTVPILIARFPQPIANIKRVFLAATEAETASVQFEEILEIAQAIATEVKAKFQFLLIVTNSETITFDPESLGLGENTTVQSIRSNFVAKTSRMLKTNDLLILSSGTHQYQSFGLFGALLEPEAIVRVHPDVATIVVHFPNLN
ncbi:MAG: universal stress protein [Limnospira sp.]